MRHNPNNRNTHRGRIDSKRSKSYCKMHPIHKKPRQWRTRNLSRPLMFDACNVLHRMLLQAFGICFSQLHALNENEYLMYESMMPSPEIIEIYKELP